MENRRRSQNNCGPMRQPSATRLPNGTTAKRPTSDDFQMPSDTTLIGEENIKKGDKTEQGRVRQLGPFKYISIGVPV